MAVNESYIVTDPEVNKRQPAWTISQPSRDEEAITYDDAIDITGNGIYSWTLLATLSIATLSMAVDIFGVSVVVAGVNCDFNLNIKQTGILLSVSFIGPILMAYPWGYIADTQGRRKSLLISLWTSYAFSTACAFSPDWITFAFFKLISTSFSSCAQSVTYTLLGESCPKRVRDSYMIIMGGILDFSLAYYVGLGYLILNMEFSYDLGFIVFTPWRLLTIVLALTNGLGAFGLLFFYESPKFLLNAEREDEALEALAGIWKRNGGKKVFPIKKVTLREEGNLKNKDVNLWRSLWNQLAPLFKPPLLWKSLQLYFLIAIVYGTNNSYFAWFPYLAEKLIDGASMNEHTDLCNMIVSSVNNSSGINATCSSKMDITLFWSSLIQGLSFVVAIFAIASLAHRKRSLIICIFSISALSSIGAVLTNDKIISFVMFLGLLLNQLAIGILFSYYVELFPTSFRGMAACLGTMVARSSALSGVSLLGDYILSHCSYTFYVSSGLMMSGVLVAFSLPKDKSRRPKT